MDLSLMRLARYGSACPSSSRNKFNSDIGREIAGVVRLKFAGDRFAAGGVRSVADLAERAVLKFEQHTALCIRRHGRKFHLATLSKGSPRKCGVTQRTSLGVLKSNGDFVGRRNRGGIDGLPRRSERARVVINSQAEEREVGAVERRDEIRRRDFHLGQRVVENRVTETNEKAVARTDFRPADGGVF